MRVRCGVSPATGFRTDLTESGKGNRLARTSRSGTAKARPKSTMPGRAATFKIDVVDQ
ncbi:MULTISPECIES: hypothetical protein [unclassified Mameliella]|uniref:hypothetical protein n=1 Tax=unclassified Mameliella TaxID=2630630 RepID=UPI00273FA585|nr:MULTISPECIES: hypothetical protein [unclassified Mameliella]